MGNEWLPIVRFVGALRRQRDGAGAAVFALVLGYALTVVALAASPDAARFFMGRFHLRTESFAAWALFQPMPWMYNFDNSFWVSRRPVSRVDLLDAPGDVELKQINHQSARAFTFADAQRKLFQQPGDHYFYLESRYRDASVLTAYVVHVDAPSKAGSRRESVRRVEVEDD